ncbi:hypothetical protein ACIRRA_12755 [Nocardia sp. NPDC101769]
MSSPIDEFRQNRAGMLSLVEQMRALEDRARAASETSAGRSLDLEQS